MLNTTSQPFSAEPCLAMAAITVSLGGTAPTWVNLLRACNGGRTRASSVNVSTTTMVGPENVSSSFLGDLGSESSQVENGVTGLTSFRQLSSGASETSWLSRVTYS